MRNARETEEPERRTYTGAWRQGVSVYTAVRGQHGPDVWSAVCEQNESDGRARPRRRSQMLEQDRGGGLHCSQTSEQDQGGLHWSRTSEQDHGGGLLWSQMPE